MKFKKIFDREWYYRKFMRLFAKFASPDKVAEFQLKHKIRLCYEATFHQPMHWLCPRTLNEKLLWISLYWQHPLKTRCADKWKVRDYITKDCGLPESLLVPIIGVYDSSSEIDFDSLPEQFVLKCNHGCGYNILVDDKSKIDKSEVCRQLDEWMATYYRGAVGEIHYMGIKPHKILCEKYLQPLNETSMTDYKMFCLNGEPQFVQVCYDRDFDVGIAKRGVYSLDEWKQFDCPPAEIERPKSLDKMIEYAKVLASEFPFVRVDYYEIEGSPMISELTFSPFGNMIDFYSNETLLKYGKKLKLPRKYKNNNSFIGL